MPELDISGVIRTLNAAGVRYVVIGGVAALVHNLPLPATVDIDVTPSRDRKNLERLADAFEALEAGLLTAKEPAWFPRLPIENWAQYDTLHLMTKYGPVDVVFTPDGAPRGYADLASSAEEHNVDETDTRALVISISTWEHLKQSAGRAKDLEHLDLFYER